MNSTRYLVTGGTGFLGSALVRRLLKEGRTVRVLDNDSRGAKSRLADCQGEVEIITGDIRDAAVVGGAVRGVDCVCHLAYINGTEFFYSKPDVILDVAVKGMSNVLDACLEHGVRQLSLASSSEVYQTPAVVPTPENVPLSVPDPLNPRYCYGGGKIICELMALNFGRKHFDRVTIFRPHNVYGPEMGWEHVIPQLAMKMARLVKEKPGKISLPIQGTGTETRAFAFIDDAVDGIVRVIDRGEHLNIYNVGVDEEATIERLARAIGQCFGREIDIVPGRLQPGGTLRRCPDISRIRALGFKPGYTLEQGLARTVPWYRDHAPAELKSS